MTDATLPYCLYRTLVQSWNKCTEQQCLRWFKVRKLALSDADVRDGSDIFHEWIAIDFRDKLSHGNPRFSGGGQVDRDRTGKMSSRKMSGKWASAGTRLKRLRRTGGDVGIVSPNASLTRDEPATRKLALNHHGRLSPPNTLEQVPPPLPLPSPSPPVPSFPLRSRPPYCG